MTTVLGLRHPDVNVGVLVADRQTTSLNLQTGIPSGKDLGRKLWKSKGENYCFGHSGMRDKALEEFVKRFSAEEFDLPKITKRGYFPELRKLNVKRLGRRVPENDKISGFILATRFEGIVKLYTCFPLGAVEERVWTSTGSGDPKIIEYMEAQRVLSEARDYLGDGHSLEAGNIIRIGLEAVRRSQMQDIFSHGLDMIVCTPEGIKDHHTELGDDFGKKLKKIQRQYRSKDNQPKPEGE